MIALVIVDLFFTVTVSKVARGECRLVTQGGTLPATQGGSGNKHETEFVWSVNFFILPYYSLYRCNYTITPLIPHANPKPTEKPKRTNYILFLLLSLFTGGHFLCHLALLGLRSITESSRSLE